MLLIRQNNTLQIIRDIFHYLLMSYKLNDSLINQEKLAALISFVNDD